MTVMVVCSVLDSAAGGYAQPFFAPTEAHAVRSFRDAVNGDGKDQLSKHPDDFTLYKLGFFDDSTGLFDCRGLEVIVRGKDVKEPDHDA